MATRSKETLALEALLLDPATADLPVRTLMSIAGVTARATYFDVRKRLGIPSRYRSRAGNDNATTDAGNVANTDDVTGAATFHAPKWNTTLLSPPRSSPRQPTTPEERRARDTERAALLASLSVVRHPSPASAYLATVERTREYADERLTTDTPAEIAARNARKVLIDRERKLLRELASMDGRTHVEVIPAAGQVIGIDAAAEAVGVSPASVRYADPKRLPHEWRSGKRVYRLRDLREWAKSRNEKLRNDAQNDNEV